MDVYKDAVSVASGDAVLRSFHQVAGAVGSAELPAALDAAVRGIGRVTRWYFHDCQVAQVATAAPNMTCHAFRHEDGIDEMIGHYVTRFVHSDPLIRVLPTVPPEAKGVALSVTPADIPDPLYRTRYMEDRDIVQRLSFIHRTGDHYRLMNVSRTAVDGEIDQGAIQQFGALSLLLFPLVLRHIQLTTASNNLRPVSVRDIEELVRTRFPQLTGRERQVCARTILGRSSKAIARELEIGVESVVTYRKRGYARTGFNCIEQLSRSVLN